VLDFTFTFFKKSLFFGDFFTCLISIAFWCFSISSGFAKFEYLYIVAIAKLAIDLLLYGIACIFSRKNPVRNL